MAEPSSLTSAREPLSVLFSRVRQTLAADPEETVTVDVFLKSFGVRGFAFLLFLLPLMNLALFMVPGLSFLFGLPMVAFAVQLLMGYRRPFFPAFLRQKELAVATLDRGLDSGQRFLRAVEPYIRPRFFFVSGPHCDRFHSGVALLLACLIALPVPFLNIPPSLGALALGLGIIQRDGIFILLAYAFAAWSLWLYRSFGLMAHFLIV